MTMNRTPKPVAASASMSTFAKGLPGATAVVSLRKAPALK